MDQTFRILPPTNIIQAELPDGRIIEGRKGSTLEKFLAPIRSELEWPLTGAIVNHELRELSYIPNGNFQVEPVTTSSSDGKNIYRRSMVFLLAATFEKVFPNAELVVDHSILSGGLFCEIRGVEIDDPTTFYARLEETMRRTVDMNLPIEKCVYSIDYARKLFERKKQMEKYQLLKYRKKGFLSLYRLENYVDYHYGYMVPSTGYLQYFAIEGSSNPNHFFLRYPQHGKTTAISPMKEDPKMMTQFRIYGDWLDKLGLGWISSLNNAIEKGRIQEVILVSESFHSQRFSQIANKIANLEPKPRVILIAGPSNSGKTTFSKRLAIELLVHGISPVPIEMDDFFVDRVNSPRDESGDYDFESIENLNLVLMDDCIHRLIDGEEVQLPRYDFLDGKSKPGKVLRIKDDQILILEGIHGMNPGMLPGIPMEQKFRIYISPLTQLNVDRYNRVSTVDTRLIRRVVRDARERGYSAEDTIGRWPSVRAGEDKYIFPYQSYADDYVNSSLVYELSALKPLAETALRQVTFGSRQYIEAKRLLSFLEWVLPLPLDLIPANSLLAEFVGGSNLKNFSVWKGNSDL